MFTSGGAINRLQLSVSCAHRPQENLRQADVRCFSFLPRHFFVVAWTMIVVPFSKLDRVQESGMSAHAPQISSAHKRRHGGQNIKSTTVFFTKPT